nr:translation initiation factor 1 [Pseudocerastium stellarioides]
MKEQSGMFWVRLDNEDHILDYISLIKGYDGVLYVSEDRVKIEVVYD